MVAFLNEMYNKSMKKKHTSFAERLLAVLILLVGLLLVGLFLTTLGLFSASKPSEEVLCTQEAKACPDGSYVGRTGPNCEFSACPGE